MTKQELINKFIAKQTNNTSLAWAEFASAVSSAPTDVRTQILNAVNARNKQAFAEIVFGLAEQKKKELATTLVNAMVADNSLTLDELLTLVD